MVNYYPSTNIIMESTLIRRERGLPPHVYGQILVSEGDEITGTHVVAEGQMPQEYAVIDVASILGIDPNDISRMNAAVRVKEGDYIEEGAELAAARRRRDRKKLPKSPAPAIVNRIDRGRIVLQLNPTLVEVYARIPGVVETVEERSVTIRSTGALIQCAWGNGRFGFGPFAMEPETGLASLSEQNTLLSSVRGRTYVLTRPITGDDLKLVAEEELGGLVAPSMPFYLQEAAEILNVPIILTEGFGNRVPTKQVFDMLKRLQRERDGAFDATMPARWEYRRPEIVLPAVGGTAQTPDLDRQLKQGDQVRIRIGIFAGEIGEITYLPEKPVRLENGLRVQAAQLKLRTRPDKPLVPLANLEIMGDSKK